MLETEERRSDMRQSENLKLPLLDPQDLVQRSNINSLAEALDEKLLKKSTSALYGLPDTAVPDDVLVTLKALVESAQNSADSKISLLTGTYIGSGTYGSEGKNLLTAPSSPKFVFVAPKSPTSLNIGYYFTAVRGQNGAMANRVGSDTTNASDHFVSLDWGDTSFTWYSSQDEICQLNGAGKEYVYAIFY